jgi:hypothetical protein
VASTSYRIRILDRVDRELTIEITEADPAIKVTKIRSLLFAFALIHEAPGAPEAVSDVDPDSTERIHAERIAADIELFERTALHAGPPQRAEFKLRVRKRAMVQHLPAELRWSSQLEDLFVR